MKDEVKILFKLIQDEDGYPPIAVESVWAKKVRTGEGYTLNNIPFFARQATLDDVVAVRNEDGHFWFDRMLKKSGNSLLRIVFFDLSRVPELRQSLAALGCTTEWNKNHNLVAVNVPSSVQIISVQAYLKAKSEEKWLDYEEPILRR